jgi:hypothetical protein
MKSYLLLILVALFTTACASHQNQTSWNHRSQELTKNKMEASTRFR